MTLYDIVQVEDSLDSCRNLKKAAESNGLKHLGINYLDSLADYLKSAKELHERLARVYVVDAGLPRTESEFEHGLADDLYKEAVGLIRRYDPNAKIFLCPTFRLDEAAKELGVESSVKDELREDVLIGRIKAALK